MKKIICAALLAALTITSITPVFAASQTAQNTAEILYEKGIFNGVGTDENGAPVFDLDRVPTRAEATTLLVTLMGKAEEAKKTPINMPFTDVPDWAAPYVSYAYNNGIASGVGGSSFDSDSEIPVTQYLTMVLNALGYKAGVDFDWREAHYLAKDIGLIDEIKDEKFLREKIVLISHRALYTKINGGETTLAENLGINLDEDAFASSNEALAVIKARYGFDIEFDRYITDEETKIFILQTFYDYCRETVPDVIMRDLAKYRRKISFALGADPSMGSTTIKLPVGNYKVVTDYEKKVYINFLADTMSLVLGKYCAEKYWRDIPDEITDEEFEKLVGEFIFLNTVALKDGKLFIVDNHAEKAMANYADGTSGKDIIKVKTKLEMVFETLCRIYDLDESDKAIIDPYGYRVNRV